MTISGVSPFNNLQQSNQSGATGIAATLQQLASALQSGNLTSAQQAYNSLQNNLSSNPAISAANTSSGTPGSPATSVLQQGLSQIGSALQSGNVSAASSAFKNLQQQLQTTTQAQATQGGQVRHHHGGGGRSGGSTATTSSTLATASSTQPGSTINVKA